MDIYTFSLFLWWSGERGKLHNHEKHIDFYVLHYFFGGAESVGSSSIIENRCISLDFDYFFGEAESVGSCRIIVTHGFLFIFIISLVERRAWEAPESLKTCGFLYIFIISLLERRAWEAPELLKTHGFLWNGEIWGLSVAYKKQRAVSFHSFRMGPFPVELK